MRILPWLFLLLLVALALSIGSAGLIGFDSQSAVLWQIRLPRVLMAVLVGAALASAGVMLQGLLRNPLAEPGLLGISAGAAAGAAFVVLPLRLWFPELDIVHWLLPLGAALGALVFASIILLLSERFGWQDNVAVILCGLALNALAMAVVGALLVLADPLATRELLFWNLGSLARASQADLLLLLAVLAPAVCLWWRLARQLDLLSLGNEAAESAGVDTQRVRRQLLISVSLVAGVAVALTGMIGFVGLVVPHMLRLWKGPAHTSLLALALPCGAGFLLLADTVARVAIAPAELPIGVITALVGAPFFLWLIGWRQRGLS
jgi:iron complex transport system permease protein